MWKILIIDDESSARYLISEMLKDKAECECAESGEEGLAMYYRSMDEDKPYDVILLDILMPEMSGLDVLKNIRDYEDERGVRFREGIPIIMVTAVADDFMKAVRLGCTNFITKPIYVEVLLNKIERVLSTDISDFPDRYTDRYKD